MKVTLHEGHYWRLKYLTQKLQNIEFALRNAQAEYKDVAAERRKWIERAGLTPGVAYTLDDDDFSAECEDPPTATPPPDLAPQVTTH